MVSKKNTYIFLAFCFILGLSLRFIYLDRITFGYDQARDAFAALDIWWGDPIKIIGPTTDIKGLFHGPLYWYLISPFYYFFHHNPLPVRIFLIFANMSGILITFLFAKKLFQHTTIAYIATFLYSVSFEAVAYSRWLSNPTLALLTIPLFFYGFWLSVNKKNIGFPLMLFSWALCVQFQFFLTYLALFLLIAFIKLYRKNIKKILVVTKKEVVLYAFSFLFLSSFVIAEAHFHFQGIKAFLHFFWRQETTNPVWQFKIMHFIHSLLNTIGNNIASQNQLFSLIILLLVTGYIVCSLIFNTTYKNQALFLYIWFISPYLIYPLERNNSYFLNVGNMYPLILIISLILYECTLPLKKAGIVITITTIVLLVGIFLGNVRLILLHNKNGDVLFSVQKNMHLADEKKVLDYLYMEGRKKDFYINTVTNPLFINTTWSYLFDWYGKSTYGYMPVWYGYPQDGVSGSSVKYSKIANQVGKTLYLIIEPSLGIPQEYIRGYIAFENLRSKKIAEKRIGNFIIEKRIIQNTIYFSRDELYAIVKK